MSTLAPALFSSASTGIVPSLCNTAGRIRPGSRRLRIYCRSHIQQCSHLHCRNTISLFPRPCTSSSLAVASFHSQLYPSRVRACNENQPHIHGTRTPSDSLSRSSHPCPLLVSLLHHLLPTCIDRLHPRTYARLPHGLSYTPLSTGSIVVSSLVVSSRLVSSRVPCSVPLNLSVPSLHLHQLSCIDITYWLYTAPLPRSTYHHVRLARLSVR